MTTTAPETTKSNKLAQLVEQTRELERKMREDGKVALKEAFVEFFHNHPEAKAIVWAQYAPHFNDGDACTFSLHEFELRVDEKLMAEDVQKMLEHNDESDDDEDAESEIGGYGNGERDDAGLIAYVENTPNNEKWGSAKKRGVALRALDPHEKSLLTDFDELEASCNAIEHAMELTFGDGVQVIATREGFAVTEHDHD